MKARAKVWVYSNCDSCRKALAFLKARGVETESHPIVEEPPSAEELRQMLQATGGELKRLFNVSGALYRELKIAEKLPGMRAEDALRLLAGHGKLIKRPFAWLQGSGGRRVGRVGFDPKEWAKDLG